MGIMFTHIRPEDRFLIRAFIKRHLTRDLVERQGGAA
jgi:hypothetical protein